MSHSTNVIQHSVLGDGVVGLHEVKGIASATTRKALAADDSVTPVVDWSHDRKICQWIYDRRYNSLHTPFWVPSTGPVWQDVWAWSLAGAGPFPGAQMDFVVNNGFLGDNPGNGHLKFNSGQTTDPGGLPNLYYVNKWVTIEGQDSTSRLYELTWNGPFTGAIMYVTSKEKNSFISWAENWSTGQISVVTAHNDSDYMYLSSRNNGYGYYIHSMGVCVIGMENNF